MASTYYGSRGDSVKEMQRRLNGLGAGLKEDGIWGNKTEAAYALLMGEGAATGNDQAKSASDMFARYQYTAPSDEQIAEQARQAVSGEYDAMESAEKQKTDRMIKALQDSISGLDPKYQARLDALDKYYSGARQDISNQAIKRGMGRSSLYLETLNQSHNDLLAAKESANTEYQTELDGLNKEINQAQYDLDTNLGSISAKRESEIRKYIDSLAQKREDTVFQMVKYNNEIAQKEAEYYAGLLEQIAAGSAASSGGSGGRRSSGRKTGSSSGSTSSYAGIMSKWNGMSAADKLNYFSYYGASLRQSNSKAYYAMKTEVDAIKRTNTSAHRASTNKNYAAGANNKLYSTGR